LTITWSAGWALTTWLGWATGVDAADVGRRLGARAVAEDVADDRADHEPALAGIALGGVDQDEGAEQDQHGDGVGGEGADEVGVHSGWTVSSLSTLPSWLTVTVTGLTVVVGA
jgi:hypothetical protein